MFDYLFSNSIIPYGSDITNPNFKHVYLGSPGTITYYRSDFDRISTVTGLAAVLANSLPGPWASIFGVASIIFNGGNMPYKFTVTTTSYQIHYVYDNSYFTHCYHQTVREYNESGSLTRSYTDYYQSVGG